MSNNTVVIFENIEQRILKEIESAHYAIFVSVAWFTNKKLFNALLDKAKSNCYVSIIIQLDEINSQSGIDYTQINIGRSECFMISKDAELLHEKFCVIDFKKVITGSYNWTYKASYNSENILILNDPSIATQYISRFEQQKAKFQGDDIQLKLSTSTKSNYENNSAIQKHSKPATITKRCPSCYKIISVKSDFCDYCGYDFEDLLKTHEIRLECKNCSKRQEDALKDIKHSNYCTYCGSSNLEWIIEFKRI